MRRCFNCGKRLVMWCHEACCTNASGANSWCRLFLSFVARFRVRKLSNDSLAIRNARVEDEGIYQCTAVNAGGETTDFVGLFVQRKLWRTRFGANTQMLLTQTNKSMICISWCDLHMFITEPPEVNISPQNRATFTAGDTIRIECQVTGVPEPTVAWLKGATYLLGEGKVRCVPHIWKKIVLCFTCASWTSGNVWWTLHYFVCFCRNDLHSFVESSECGDFILTEQRLLESKIQDIFWCFD